MGTTNRQREHRETQLREAKYRDAAIERMIRDNYTASYMSDSKWIRLFDAASDCMPPDTKCEWRFVDDERTWQTSLPDGTDVSEGYYECMYGIFLLKHVESIVLTVADPESLRTTMAKSGKFCTVVVESGLQVFGYR